MREPLEEFAARIARHPTVHGIVVLGSGARRRLTAASDYDLLVILDQPAPGLFVVLTSVDGRLTDVIFESAAVIRELGRRDKDFDDWQFRLVHWLISGEVLFDRTGILQDARTRLGRPSIKAPQAAGSICARWFSVNYDLAQTQRIATSSDPVYVMTVDLRLLFGLHQLWMAYFTFRGLPWRGDKEAIRHLRTHDPLSRNVQDLLGRARPESQARPLSRTSDDGGRTRRRHLAGVRYAYPAATGNRQHARQHQAAARLWADLTGT